MPKTKPTPADANGKPAPGLNLTAPECALLMEATGTSTIGAALTEAERLAAIDWEAEERKLAEKRAALDLRQAALEKSKREAPDTPLTRLLDRCADSADLAEPLASMPIEEMDTLLAALRPGSTLDRRAKALAFARRIVRTLETHDRPRAIPSEVVLAVEAIEKAWAHFRPVAPSFEMKSGRFAYAERVIKQIEFGQNIIGGEIDLAAANGEAAPRSVATHMAKLVEVAAAIEEMEPTIPAERWVEAIYAWRGEIPAAEGKPKRGTEPYRWDRVLYQLLTGETVVEPMATQFRDNLRAWRRDRAG